MKKNNLQDDLRELRLKLIEVQTKLEPHPLSPWEAFPDTTGPMPAGYKSRSELKTEEKTLKKQIHFMEVEMARAEQAPQKRKQPKPKEHEKVKAEFERIRKQKKILEGQEVDKILEDVANNLGKSFEATKKNFYYKPKT